jgi:LacI family transcriptional regulator
MSSLKDVAEAAGVGVATASRALSGQPRVRPETRRHIEEVAKKLGYQPNSLARALRRNESYTIGLVIPDLENPFFTTSAAILQGALAKEGYQLLLCCSNGDATTDGQLLRSLVEKRVDGIAHVPCTAAGASAIRKLNPQLPIVEFMRRSNLSSADSVVADEKEGSSAIVDHLVSLGHRRIAMIAGPPELSTTTARVAGFRAAVQRHGLPDNSCPVLEGPDRDSYDERWGAEATERLLNEHPDVTAIFASSSRLVLGVLGVARARGIRIPDDMSLAGFLSPHWLEVAYPAITSYELPIREMGAMAGHLLLKRIVDIKADRREPPTTVRVEGRLVARDSTAAPRATPLRARALHQ